MEEADSITAKRLEIWNRYHQAFEALEASGRLRRPVIPDNSRHNAHMYYLLLRDLEDRSIFIDRMKESGINCVFHYIPLHSSPMGLKISRLSDNCKITDIFSERLVRLPLWIGLDSQVEELAQLASQCIKKLRPMQ